ncbi:hypothetical protein [Paracoccus zhejiangensis]|uniref:DUF2971 domain-containing protein n=1 Tax=Paracoccus zhejiangensis TaxID=1077935 RepID=A0A2H5EXR4_9RHOB|nr:hypothetical protein [Paracoccus zhejiangensis]AUH64064.1 hypothetical protein CX676_07745 [Paracoccus zhejiangensis]
MTLNFLNLTETERDKPIYRIMKEEHVIRLFTERRNVLSQIHNWKDKFENFQMALGGVLDGERFNYGFKNDFVGQCWTRHARSEAMWGIYANDASQRFLRIKSTPRKLLTALVNAHPEMPQDTCFLGKVLYKTEKELKGIICAGGQLSISAEDLARPLLLKRNAFKHENEVRLLFFGKAEEYHDKGLYRYDVDPHNMVTQIMADPNRDRAEWTKDKARLKRETGFAGEIKRSKMYDPPDWAPPVYSTVG